jgi:hypothetical protein
MRILLRDVLAAHAQLQNNQLVVRVILDTLRKQPELSSALPEDATIPADHAAVLWAHAHIAHHGVLREMELVAVIRAFCKPLLAVAQGYVDALETNASANMRPCLLALADRRIVSLSEWPGSWFDLQTGQMAHNRPAVFEGISYNLAHPIKMEWVRLQAAHELARTDAHLQTH